MEFKQHFKKKSDTKFQCVVKTTEDGAERECAEFVSVSKGSFWNLRRHMSRKHEAIYNQQNEKKSKGLLSLIAILKS